MVDKVAAQHSLCNADESQLIIVDLQTRLLAAMPEQDAKRVVANSGSLITAGISLGIPILYTEQYPKGLGRSAPDILNKIPDSVKPLEKTSFSCCASEIFCNILSENSRKQIILVGQETHVCIIQTALDLLQLGYQVFVVEDAVCSRKPSHKTNALQRLHHQGAIITNYESVLFEWLKDASHPQFKTLSKLVL